MALIEVGLLDFCNVSENGNAREGIVETIETAVLAEDLGYKRYWLAEHWTNDVSTPCPELLTPIVAGMTEHIRVGPAGVLLNFYSPLKVASNALLAEAVFPGRIDLGLARGGAHPNIAKALSENSLQPDYNTKAQQVVDFVERRAPLTAYPANIAAPEIWILGSGPSGASLAASLGVCFGLSLFHANALPDPTAVIETYLREFSPGQQQKPCISLAIAGAIVRTEQQKRLLQTRYSEGFIRPNFIGTTNECDQYITSLISQHKVNEITFLDLCTNIGDRHYSLQQLALMCKLNQIRDELNLQSAVA